MASKKAALRELMKGATRIKEKKIDSPLVRYNDLGQAVCKICNVVIKSEALWTPHMASSQHKERIAALKAKAQSGAVSKAPPPPASASGKPAARAASALPGDFFDAPKQKQVRTEAPAEVKSPSPAQPPPSMKSNPEPDPQARGVLPSDFFDKPSSAPPQPVTTGTGKTDKAGAALPKGFFDDVEKDHKARGEKYQKPDIKEELKEFEKMIKSDINEIDTRQAEEEAEAAEERAELQQIEQRSFAERIALLKQKKEQHLAEAKAKAAAKANGAAKEAEPEDDEEDEEDLDQLLDWRAKTF